MRLILWRAIWDSVTSSAFGGLATPPQLGWLPSHARLPAVRTAIGSSPPGHLGSNLE